MPTRKFPAVRYWTGTAWSNPLRPEALKVATTPSAWTPVADPITGKINKLWYANTPTSWAPTDAPDAIPPAPATPTNFRATNIGADPFYISFAWDAMANATSYNIYVAWTGQAKYFYTSTTSTSWTSWSMGGDYAHQFWVEAVGEGGVSPAHAGPINVHSGHSAQYIAGGSGDTGGRNFNSRRGWRQNNWNYDGTCRIGWFDTEAYRWATFFEVTTTEMRNVIASVTPQVNGYWGNITATGFWVHVDREGTTGNYSTAYTLQVSLGNGINYGNTAEPGAQGNVTNISMPTANAGRVQTGLPANWATAIFQQHASYNGLLWRPYTNAGARQQYMRVETNSLWQMTYSWPTITTVNQQNTYYW